MAFVIPTTQESFDAFLANLESNLNQTSPLNDKAFLRVLSGTEAMIASGLYKFAAERVLQNLALTATGIDLDRIGQNYGVIRKPAEAAVLTIELPATTGTVIPASVDYVGAANNVRYRPGTSVTSIGGIATSSVTAQTLGTIGNLNVSDTMTIGTQIAGAETVAEVVAVTNIGADLETDEVYRERVLFAIRSTTGGSNAVDHRIWSEEVAGVKRAYPYTGKPESSLPGIDAASSPPERTVFIESDATIDPDGIASTALKDEVRASINNDPVTGASRPALGLTDSTLFVETITRTPFYVEITGFNAGTGVEATIKSEIEAALTQYFVSISMYVPAIDLEQERNDQITKLTLSDVVQDILTANGASAQLIEFDDTIAVPAPLDIYTLDEGELAKLADTDGITYA